MKILLLNVFLIFMLNLQHVKAWDNDDLEIFDLVEQIDQNFYTLMGINPVSDTVTWISKIAF